MLDQEAEMGGNSASAVFNRVKMENLGLCGRRKYSVGAKDESSRWDSSTHALKRISSVVHTRKVVDILGTRHAEALSQPKRFRLPR